MTRYSSSILINEHPRKYVIEYDISGKLRLPSDFDFRQPSDIIEQITDRFKTGNFKLVDSYIVYGTLDETNYYEEAEPSGSTVFIIETNFMQFIYPDYSEFIDYMIDETLKLLQSGTLYTECYFKVEQLDIDVFMLSLKSNEDS